MSSDFVVAHVVGSTASAGAEVLRGARPARGRAFPGKKKALVVVAVTLLALLAAFAVLIAASNAPNADHHSSAASTQHDQSRAAAPQMSGKEALDAYGKLPLSFIPNESQTDEAVRYYAQGAGYGFFFTKEGPGSPSPTVREVATRWTSPSWGPIPTRHSKPASGFRGRSTTYKGTTLPSGRKGCLPTASSSTGGCGLG